MSLLEKIIFIADYIEPGRKPIPELDEIRQLAFIDIDKAMVKILENTLKHLNETGASIDKMTQFTYECYVEKSGIQEVN
jgi:HD superfamily phosphohydrolase YqeK